MKNYREKIEILKPLIRKAFKENDLTKNDLNLLCGYIWMYQGAQEELEFGDFFRGLLSGQFSSASIIEKALKEIKWQIKKELF
jgi:hypothetical protein